MQRKVIAYALFGQSPSYAAFLPAIIRANVTLFPPNEGWKTVIYCDKTNFDRIPVYGDDLVIKFCKTWPEDKPIPRGKAALWRMTPDVTVDYVFARDLDSLPTPRERACMEGFIESGAPFHNIFDHPLHSGIMGGLCGFDVKKFIEHTGIECLRQLYDAGEKAIPNLDWDVHSADQDVLNQVLIVDKKIPILLYQNPPKMTGPLEWTKTAVGMSSKLLHEAEALVPHMGAAGFAVQKAINFYEKHGDTELMARIRKAEGL